MSDQLGLFDRHDDETGELDLAELRAALTKTAASAPKAIKAQPRRDRRALQAAAAARRRRRRARSSVIAVLVLGVIAGAIVLGLRTWRNDTTAIADFPGGGTTDTIVRVDTGDTLTDIADTLAADKVVASAASFVDAAAGNADIKTIRNGYYRVKLHASAAAALTTLTNRNPDGTFTARVGELRLVPGRQLSDVSAKTGGGGAVTSGYITAITKAACVPMNGISKCFTADQLWQVEETADPSQLRVVTWADDGIRRAPDPRKRLEGLLAPGDYDIAPGSTPLQALQSVLSGSVANWNATDIVAGSKALGRNPYQVAVVASLIEREGIVADMPKIARVVYNRLAAGMKLQFDSTVNYSLDRAQISTTAAERSTGSPYNTYTAPALPPTPISSPGGDAVDAALNPTDGNWLYFVKVDLKGNSCFSATLDEHNRCVARAHANGVFGR